MLSQGPGSTGNKGDPRRPQFEGVTHISEVGTARPKDPGSTDPLRDVCCHFRASGKAPHPRELAVRGLTAQEDGVSAPYLSTEVTLAGSSEQLNPQVWRRGRGLRAGRGELTLPGVFC